MIRLRLHPSYFLQRKVIACLSTRTNTTTRSEDSSMKCYHIKGFGEKCKVTAYTNTGHDIETDLPRVIGGSDTAPQPVEYLLAAWMGCTQATAVFVGRNMRPRRLNISRLEFDLTAYRDERGAIGGSLPLRKDSPLPDVPSRLQLVSGVVKVMLKENEKVSDEEMMTLEKQTETRCPVANMMHNSGCVFNIKWVDGNNQPQSSL